MGKMKGFIHIVEIIIVVLAMFAVLLQLLNTPRMDTDWSRVLTAMKANDLLYSMDAAGINWFDRAQVESAINSTLNVSNLIYSVELVNVIKPKIRVGCICYNSGDFDAVRNALTNPAFSINGQSPDFQTENITGATAGIPEMPFEYDVIVVMDHNISYKNAYKYLENGRGIVEVRDLDVGLAGQNAGDMWLVHNRLFGVEYSSMMPAPTSAEITFSAQSAMPGSTYFNVYNYFHHIPNSSGLKINETHYFTDFLEDYEKINVTSYSAEAVLRQSGTDDPALVLNSAVVGNKGRTAWLSGLGAGRSLADDDMAVLTKSLVIWASGEKYSVIPGTYMVSPMRAVMYKAYNMEMMQPVEISLTMGNIY